MKLSADKESLWVDESLTLGKIPAEAFADRLGSRSALEWIVDQYQAKGESDPNREEDPGVYCTAGGSGGSGERGDGGDCEGAARVYVM